MAKETVLRRDNHYVPRVYLKRFATLDGRVLTFEVLVAHSGVPLWRPRSIKGVAYHAHLYTRIAAGFESDEIEKWLDREFEAPAEESLRKATSNERLTPTDWRHLVRFLAAQDVRTPARLLESLQRWRTSIPKILEETMQEGVRKFTLAKQLGIPTEHRHVSDGDYIPLRLTREIGPLQGSGMLKGETISGRGLWLCSIRHLLRQTANVLHKHRWTILHPPDGLNWFTSDDPVIKLNYYGSGQYDFNGGWGNPGSEILLPIGPRHLLYTIIGQKPPRRGEILAPARAELVRRFIAEHAHRTIFSATPESEVPKLRPRIVDAGLLRNEKEQWRQWHSEQTTAERVLMGWGKS